MAKFEIELPKELVRQIEKLEKDSEMIIGGMTRAGAEDVLSKVITNMPTSLKNSGFSNNVSLTKTYKTPTDDGINTKVVITGYFTNHNGERTPAPLVANMFEYGSSKKEYPKQPFFRKSFNKKSVLMAMEKAQKELSGGLLE